jgi:hypothetical protein
MIKADKKFGDFGGRHYKILHSSRSNSPDRKALSDCEGINNRSRSGSPGKSSEIVSSSFLRCIEKEETGITHTLNRK